MPDAKVARFGLAVRTRLLDDWLEALNANPIAAVFSVGCGPETRPRRLHLPNQLRWIEADLAGCSITRKG